MAGKKNFIYNKNNMGGRGGDPLLAAQYREETEAVFEALRRPVTFADKL